jgi:hypothetical protein
MYNNSINYIAENKKLIISNTTGIGTINGASYVDGIIRRNLAHNSTNNRFPVGNLGKQKNLFYLTNINNTSGNKFWDFIYKYTSANSAGKDPLSIESSGSPSLATVSQSEFWVITPPLGASSCNIKIPLTGTSDIVAALGLPGTIANRDKLTLVKWNSATNKWEKAGGTLTYGTDGTTPIITTTTAVSFSGSQEYFTLGSTETITIPTGQISSPSSNICAGETYNLTISLTGTSPWQIQYSDGVTTTGWIAVNTSPHVIPLTPATTTTYTLTAVRTTAGPVNGVVYGSPVTATVRPLPTVFTVGGGGFICNTETVSITLNDSEIGFTYELYRDGLLLGNQQAGTGNAISFTGIDVAGTYTIRAFNNLRPSCTLWMSGSAAVTVGSSAFAQITSVLSDNPACEGLPVQFEITFNGTPPFTFSMADNFGNTWNNIVVTLAQLTGVGPYTYTFTLPDQYPTWVAPALPNAYIYNVTNITDSSGCGVGSIGAGVTVNVYKLPETGPQYHIPNTFGE